MTEHKWLTFAGFLNGCIYDTEHTECPFKQHRTKDQYQRLEFLMSISEAEANKMMSNCLCHQSESYPIAFVKKNEVWGMAVAI